HIECDCQSSDSALPFKARVAANPTTAIYKMIGHFCKVVALNGANRLLVQDTVGNIKRIRQTILEQESTEGEQSESFTHVCKYIKARDAERILKDMLGDPKESGDRLQGMPFGPGFGFGG